jgi:hypothetical protein
MTNEVPISAVIPDFLNIDVSEKTHKEWGLGKKPQIGDCYVLQVCDFQKTKGNMKTKFKLKKI